MEVLLRGLNLVRYERVHWVEFVAAVSVTLMHLYSLLQMIG